jgi:hypothetical protein
MDDICPVVLDGVTGFGGRVEVVLFKLVAQLMHIRRCTHEEPASRHAAQTPASAGRSTVATSSRCVQRVQDSRRMVRQRWVA